MGLAKVRRCGLVSAFHGAEVHPVPEVPTLTCPVCQSAAIIIVAAQWNDCELSRIGVDLEIEAAEMAAVAGADARPFPAVTMTDRAFAVWASLRH
jgi:hypothetical protein